MRHAHAVSSGTRFTGGLVTAAARPPTAARVNGGHMVVFGCGCGGGGGGRRGRRR